MSSERPTASRLQYIHRVMEDVKERDAIGRKTLRRVAASAERRRNMVDMIVLFVVAGDLELMFETESSDPACGTFQHQA